MTLEKAMLVFLDAIEKNLDDIKKTEGSVLRAIEELKSVVGRKKKFKMVPERNTHTQLIQEVVITEEAVKAETATRITGLKKCPNCGGELSE
jgi:hypothetical protein